jgi:hypothetical protein
MSIPSRTREELRQLALDWLAGKLFTDHHCRADDLPLAFMPLALMKPSQIAELQGSDLGLIFEYVDKAGPRGINGMPFFFSMQILNRADAQVVMDLAKRLQVAQDSVQ